MGALSRLRGHPYDKSGMATIPMILLLLLSLVIDTTLAAPHYRHHPQQQVTGAHRVLRQDNGNAGQHLGPTTTIAIVVDGASLPTRIASSIVPGVQSNDSIEAGIAKAAGQDDKPLTSIPGHEGVGNIFVVASPAPISSLATPVSPAASESQQHNGNNGPPGRRPSPVVVLIDGDEGDSQQNTIPLASQNSMLAASEATESNINTVPELPPPGPNLNRAGDQQAQQEVQQFVSSPNIELPSSAPEAAAVVDQLSPKPPPPAISTISPPSPPAISSISAPPLEEHLAPSTAATSTTPFISSPSPSADDSALISPTIPPTTPLLPAQDTQSLPLLPVTNQVQTPSETITKTLSIRLTTLATTVTHLITVTETFTPSTSSSIPPSTATAEEDLVNGVLSNNGTSLGENSTISIGAVSIEALLTSSSMSSGSGSTFLTNTRNGTMTTTATGLGSGYNEHYLYRQQYRPLTAS